MEGVIENDSMEDMILVGEWSLHTRHNYWICEENQKKFTLQKMQKTLDFQSKWMDL